MSSAFSGEPQGEQVTMVNTEVWIHSFVCPAFVNIFGFNFTSYHKRFGRNTYHEDYWNDTTAPVKYVNYSSMYYICKQITSPLTCRLGSGEDKLCGAAALDLSIAGVNVDAVNCERL